MVKITLTNRQLCSLHRGLSSLDAVREGEAVIGFEFVRDVAWRLTCAGVQAEDGKRSHDILDRAAALKFGVYEGMAQNDQNAKALDEYKREIEELLDKTVTIEVDRFTMDELLTRPPSDDRRARKTNPIPLSVLRNLFPILDEK
jgi:hypothetical protein